MAVPRPSPVPSCSRPRRRCGGRARRRCRRPPRRRRSHAREGRQGRSRSRQGCWTRRRWPRARCGAAEPSPTPAWSQLLARWQLPAGRDEAAAAATCPPALAPACTACAAAQLDALAAQDRPALLRLRHRRHARPGRCCKAPTRVKVRLSLGTARSRRPDRVALRTLGRRPRGAVARARLPRRTAAPGQPGRGHRLDARAPAAALPAGAVRRRPRSTLRCSDAVRRFQRDRGLDSRRRRRPGNVAGAGCRRATARICRVDQRDWSERDVADPRCPAQVRSRTPSRPVARPVRRVAAAIVARDGARSAAGPGGWLAPSPLAAGRCRLAAQWRIRRRRPRRRAEPAAAATRRRLPGTSMPAAGTVVRLHRRPMPSPRSRLPTTASPASDAHAQPQPRRDPDGIPPHPRAAAARPAPVAAAADRRRATADSRSQSPPAAARRAAAAAPTPATTAVALPDPPTPDHRRHRPQHIAPCAWPTSSAGEREQLPALKISMHMWGPTPGAALRDHRRRPRRPGRPRRRCRGRGDHRRRRGPRLARAARGAADPLTLARRRLRRARHALAR